MDHVDLGGRFEQRTGQMLGRAVARGCIRDGVLAHTGEGGEVRHRVPAADVAPLAAKGHHRHIVVLLHHGIVDGIGRTAFEKFQRDSLEVQIGMRGLPGGRTAGAGT